jgi:RNase P/RNase MRP subunit POP5
MVRFKNRYILANIEDLNLGNELNERNLLKLLKDEAENMMGQLFLAKIAYSLQIKYLNLGKAVIRVPRDHCK